MMLFLWISWQIFILTGTVIFTYGAEEKDSLSSSTTTPDYNTNEDYPDNYPDYHDRDYPNPDYYDQVPDREGRSRSFPEDVPEMMSEERYLKQLRSTIPGIPGVDYPMYQSVPDTSFQCQDQRNPGFYGDVEAQCQVFHICQEDGRHDSFLCPVGTVFNQMNFICDWWFNFRCDDTPTFFHLNAQFYTSSGATPASVMIRETMKKMRRFTEGTKYKSSLMKNSMRNSDNDFNKGMKRISMDNQKFMAEMERRRIMNLFMPKMRPSNFWKRLRATKSTDKQIGDNLINVPPVGVTAALKIEDFKQLASTKHLDFVNSDYTTTSAGTTEFSPERTSTNHILETTSQFMNNTIQSNQTENISVFESSSDDYPMSNDIEIENVEQNDATTRSSFNENVINIPLSISTASLDVHSVSENITLNSIPIEITEEDFNDIMALIDLNIENSTDILTPLKEEYFVNQTDISETNNSLSESPSPSTHLPMPSPNTELNIALYPPSSNISSATLGNGTHVSVSVTIRAKTGISRLKWRRVGQSKKRKNLKLQDASANADVDDNRDSFMDVEYRKRPMRNKKLRSRIMWIPTKNNSLSRKSHWKIFLNSRPQNFSAHSLRKVKEQTQKLQITDVKSSEMIQESNLKKEEMQKLELIGDVKSSIQIQEAELEKNKSLESNTVQNPKAATSYTDPTSETLMTESTKLSFTLMALAESTTSSSTDVTLGNASELTVTNGEEYQANEPDENLTNSEATTNCEAICIKLLKSMGIENYSVTNNGMTSKVNVSTTDVIKNDLFGRRSFLEISPSDQWTVKYDPGPDCDEDEDGNKILVRGWSVIIDSGAVTKEKTVKRRGCQNTFDDTKIIVMQNMLPDHETTPKENTPNIYGRGTSNKPNISFGSMDQQYWFTLVKNWLESSPKSHNKENSISSWGDDNNEFKTQDKGSNTHGSGPSTNANWMEINPSRGDSWPREFPSERTQNRIQDYNQNSQRKSFGEQKKIRDSNDSPFNDAKHDWSNNRNHKNIKQGKNKQNSKHSGNGMYAPSSNGFSDTRTNWNSNNDWQQDALSSQSDRKEWKINAGQQNNKNISPRTEKWDNIKKESWANGNSQSNTKSENWPPSFSKGNNNKFRPRRGNQDWSSTENRDVFSVGRSKGWPETQSNQMHNSKKTKRDQDEWFMSSEENMRISPPHIDTPVWKDDRSQWNSDQYLKAESNPKNAKAGFPSDQNDKRSWSSDSSNKPGSSTKMQMDDDFDSRKKGSWSSDEDVDKNKRIHSDTKGGSWSSGRSKNGRFPPESIDRSWSSDDKNFKRNDQRKGYPDTNTKPNWSSKPRDSQEDWPSTKSRSRDGPAPLDKSNHNSRQNSKGWSSDSSNPVPPIRSGSTWDVENKRNSNFPTNGNKNVWSSSRRLNDDSWTSDDQQRTKADWPSNDEDWSDRRKSEPSDSRKGRQKPSSNKKRDSAGPPSSDKNEWVQDSQRDISDWSADDRQSRSDDWSADDRQSRSDDWSADDRQSRSDDWSADDRQSRSDDWSSKSKDTIPSFNPNKGRGRDFKASKSRNTKDDWSNDSRRDNTNWSSDKPIGARDEWNKRGLPDEQKSLSWSPDDRQISSDDSDTPNSWSFENQKDISNDDRSSKDWQATSKNKGSRGSSWGDNDSSKASFGSKSGWDAKGNVNSQKPSSIKGNKPALSQGQNGWNDPQMQTGQWKMDSPKTASDWSSSLPDNKRGSTKTKSKLRPNTQTRWADDDRSPRSNNSPNQMDEYWPMDIPSKPTPMTGFRTNKGSSSWSDSWDSSKDWSSDNAGKMSWSSDTGENQRPGNKGSDSAWNQDTLTQTNVKSQNPVSSWNTKGRTKTAMVMPSSSKGSSEMMPRKPWKDGTDQTNPMKNIKGGKAMEEEKIVWSVQISSNGETGNGWVPITLRPEFRKRVNQTRDQSDDKKTPMNDDGWSGLEQKSDTWDSAGLDKMSHPPQFRTDMITENIPSSTQIPDSSYNHPFYIPVASNRFKREVKPLLRIRHHVRPRDSAPTIFKVIRNGIELKSNQTNENRFYLASANILVGDNHSTKKHSFNFGQRHKSKLDIIGKREYNETIKNTVPSLIQIRNIKHENITAKKAKKFKSNQDWDGLMQESETKESWSAPIDDSNVPASGWIPLFRVVKVPNRDTTNFKNNTSQSEGKNTEIKRIMKSESTVYIDTKPQHHNSSNIQTPNETIIRNVNIDLSKPELKSFSVKNITMDAEVLEKKVNFEQEMKVGNQTLRIIPFSDIMKQLRVKPTDSSPTDSMISSTSYTSTEDEWNIPITASPKTYAIKLVNGSEMQNHNLTNSWTFTKRIPKGREAWILVKENQFENKTTSNENRNSTSRNSKAAENDGYIRIPYKIIVGNRTAQSEDSAGQSERKRVENNSDTRSNNSPNLPSNEFSFDLKNWQKDSGWTPLLRAVGSVKPKKIDPSANKSIGDG